MKIALCLEYPIHQPGGTEVLVRELVYGLADRHEILLVSDDPSTILRDPIVGGKITGHLPWNPAAVTFEKSKQLAAALKAADIDLAHFHFGGNYAWDNRFPGCCPVSHLAPQGVPCVSTVHSVVNLLHGYCGPQKPIWFKLAMLPLAWWGKMEQLRHVHAEVAVSQDNLQKLRRWYRPFRHRFVQICHSRLHGDAASASLAKRELVILNVGHLAWCKGQLILAQAFAQVSARHPDWRLQLAGHDGGEGVVQKIRDLEKTHHLAGRIELLGARSDAPALMQRAAIYVQPSLWEAFGLALEEAMFYGCAVVGSRVGGIPELIQAHGRTGLIFEPGQVAQLAAILEELMNDETRREQLGRDAAASIRDRGMTAEAMVQRHIELYESITRIT